MKPCLCIHFIYSPIKNHCHSSDTVFGIMQCGGMLPWLGWKAFWFSTFTDPGNGGPLLQPQGQGSRILYKVPVSSRGNVKKEFDDFDNQQENTGISTEIDDAKENF